MFCGDEFCVDFRLVSSYVPVFSLIARGWFLCALIEGLWVFGVADSVILMIVAGCVFWDYHWNRASQFTVLCGGLIGPALMCTTTRAFFHSDDSNGYSSLSCQGLEGIVVAYVCDIAWAIASSFHLACLAFYPAYVIHHMPHIWTILAVVKTWSMCDRHTVIELPVRVCVFYVAFMLILYAAPFLPLIDRAKHRIASAHVCLHLLMVHVYVLVATVCVFAFVLAHIYFKNKGVLNDLSSSKTNHAISTLHLQQSSQLTQPKNNASQMSAASSSQENKIRDNTSISISSTSDATDAGLLEQFRRAKAQKDKLTAASHI